MAVFEFLETCRETNQSIAVEQRALKWLEKGEEKSNKQEIPNNL